MSVGHDLKRTNRRGSGRVRFRKSSFALLAAGLVAAVGVFVWQDQLASTRGENAPGGRAAPGKVKDETPPAVKAEPVWEFPQRLLLSEVVIPTPDTGAAVPIRSAPINRPGDYVLHLGIFSTADEAERLRMSVVRLGVRAAVQPIPIDTDVKYRVRIGAISRLDELNRIRAVLQRSGIYAEPIRVGE